MRKTKLRAELPEHVSDLFDAYSLTHALSFYRRPGKSPDSDAGDWLHNVDEPGISRRQWLEPVQLERMAMADRKLCEAVECAWRANFGPRSEKRVAKEVARISEEYLDWVAEQLAEIQPILVNYFCAKYSYIKANPEAVDSCYADLGEGVVVEGLWWGYERND